MPPTVDWLTKVITVPQSDLTLISGNPLLDGSLWDCDTNALRLDLKAIEASPEGAPFEKIVQHNTEVTVAGTTYARTLEIINGYKLFFEETGLDYTVRFLGSNNNFWETPSILIPTPHVSYVSTNSAGLVVTAASGLTPDESAQLATLDQILGGIHGQKVVVPSANALAPLPGYLILWEDDGVTLIGHKEIYEDEAKTIGYRGKGIGWESDLIAGLPPGYP